jgi:Protein of unknown function (DUF732)
MFLRVATLVAAASATVAIGSAAPAAQADTPDQQFLNLVHANGVPGQDDSLIAFAHEFCDTNDPVLNTVFPLYGQGVLPGQIYILKVAAQFCPPHLGLI